MCEELVHGEDGLAIPNGCYGARAQKPSVTVLLFRI
jgi:hypothetical protein